MPLTDIISNIEDEGVGRHEQSMHSPHSNQIPMTVPMHIVLRGSNILSIEPPSSVAADRYQAQAPLFV